VIAMSRAKQSAAIGLSQRQLKISVTGLALESRQLQSLAKSNQKIHHVLSFRFIFLFFHFLSF
jgi:hypothetical protein